MSRELLALFLGVGGPEHAVVHQQLPVYLPRYGSLMHLKVCDIRGKSILLYTTAFLGYPVLRPT
jgi:hypothetical protein